MKFDFSSVDLNAMSVEQRRALLSGGFSRWKMEQAARHIAPFWWVAPLTSPHLILPNTLRARNGTAFFAEIGGTTFCITAAHVYRGFLEEKLRYPHLICRLGEGSFTFDPEANPCDIGGPSNIDIATFHISRDALEAINKEPIIVPADAWPPCHPFSGQESTLIGYPGISKLWLSQREISFGIYCAGPSVGSASDRQITLPFERDFWIDILGNGLPPIGMDLGGISGGPLLFLTEKDCDWSLNVGGVISEMPSSPLYELVIAEPARFIGADGKILSENAAPIRHYIRKPILDESTAP